MNEQTAAARELVETEAQLDLLKDRRARLLEPITAQVQDLNARRTALRERLPVLMRASSSRSLDLVDDDDEKLGTISLKQGVWSAEVTDEAAFVAWVAERYPDEVETVRVVRPAFAGKLRDEAKRATAPVVPDTGERIPGLVVEQGKPYVSTTPTAAARDRAAELLNIPLVPEELVPA